MSNERIALYVCGQSHHGSCELNGVWQIQCNPLQTVPMLQSGTVRRRPQVTVMDSTQEIDRASENTRA